MVTPGMVEWWLGLGDLSVGDRWDRLVDRVEAGELSTEQAIALAEMTSDASVRGGVLS